MYMQGGPGIFKGDLYFYRVDGDLREKVKTIDTKLCPLYLLTGEMRFWAGMSPESLELIPFPTGQCFHVKTGTVHRMEAVSDIDILEASTPELDDVVRLEDRYGRT